MIRSLLLLLFVPGVASAVICKTVGPDGSVTYADVPAAQCEQPVDLPAFSTYTPRVPVRATAGPVPGAAVDGADFAGYRALSITQPADGGTVRDNTGQVNVSLQLEPGLQSGHHVRLTLDGAPVSGNFGGLAIDLSNVPRGTHTLTAAIHDAGGARLIASDTIRFTMRQASILNRPPTGGEPSDPGGVGPGAPQPPSPGGSPVIRPNPVPSGPAPPGNSPAYRPAYGG